MKVAVVAGHGLGGLGGHTLVRLFGFSHTHLLCVKFSVRDKIWIEDMCVRENSKGREKGVTA